MIEDRVNNKKSAPASLPLLFTYASPLQVFASLEYLEDSIIH